MAAPWRPWLLALLLAPALASGCDGGGQVQPKDDDAGDDDTGDDDSGDDDAGDELPVADVAYHLHGEIQSLIYVTWTQLVPTTARVEVRFDGGDWAPTPDEAIDTGDHEVLVLGVPYDTAFEYRLVNDHGDEVLHSSPRPGTTGPLPEGLPIPNLLASEPDRWEPTGRYLLASINQEPGGWTDGHYWKFVVDREGRVVWALLTPGGAWTIYLRVSYDGDDLLWDAFTYWSDMDMGAASQVHRMKIDGTIVESVPTPGGHHAFTELDDGSLVWGAADWKTETLEIRSPEGVQSTLWRCEDYHDALGIGEFCQSNSLYWHEPSDSFLYSFYSTSSVAEIDAATGTTLRVWGQVPTPWQFDPPDAGCFWQHGVTYTDAGTLLWSTHRSHEDAETVAREYEVDDASQTLHEVWSFGLGEGVAAYTAGEAHRLPGGNTLHNYGSDSRLREVTPAGEIVWELKWPGDRLVGRSIFLEDLYIFAP